MKTIATTEDLFYLSIEQLTAVVPQVGIVNKIWCRLRPGHLKAAGLIEDLSAFAPASSAVGEASSAGAPNCAGAPTLSPSQQQPGGTPKHQQKAAVSVT